jgi:hypothetical protein
LTSIVKRFADDALVRRIQSICNNSTEAAPYGTTKALPLYNNAAPRRPTRRKQAEGNRGVNICYSVALSNFNTLEQQGYRRGSKDADGRDARNGVNRIDGCGYGAGSHPARVGVRPSGGQGFLRREAEARATSYGNVGLAY